MPKIDPTYELRSVLVSAITVSAIFVTFGPVVSDSLIRYGVEIFSPSTMSQDLAVLLAMAISFPTFPFSESLPVSRFWMAVNGVFWGVVGYLFLVNAARFLSRRRSKQS